MLLRSSMPLHEECLDILLRNDTLSVQIQQLKWVRVVGLPQIFSQLSLVKLHLSLMDCVLGCRKKQPYGSNAETSTAISHA